MLKGALLIGIVTIGVMSTCAPARAASIRDAYFSKGSVVQGQIYRTTGELPGRAKEFTSGTDKVARLFVIFGDIDAHKVGGELKAADGKVVARMARQHPPFSGSFSPSWRFMVHSFNLESLEPGEYRLDLIVDDQPHGTYTFILR